jgi:signal transduction histidine kinase/DNA-binding response OmpR family regulator
MPSRASFAVILRHPLARRVIALAGLGLGFAVPGRASEAAPRFLESPWLILAAVLIGVVVVAAVVRLRGARLRAGQAELERLVEERTATIALQAEKLRELDRLRSQFFTNVSHEFRTPLTLILGPLEDVLAGKSGRLEGRLAQDLELARKNARRLLGLVDQLLDIARLDTGRLDLKVRRSNLALHLSRRVEAFLPLAERRSTVLELVIPDGPVDLYFDEVQLEKVFDNLIGNALKFTPEGGHVRVALVVRDGEGRAEVTVEDDGPGIPAQYLPRIFDRFYQVDATARRRFPGTGIGLALARQIVELHGGTIAVVSGEGRGTCFTVTLNLGGEHLSPEVMAGRIPTGEVLPEDMPSFPALAEAALWETDPPFAGDDPVPDDDRTTVLVVDDHAGIRGYVRRHLEGAYRVLEAVDGLDGLAQARRFIPDLIVSDVMMPGLDGHSLFKTLREDPDLSFIPFVLLTAQASAESRLQGLEEGADDYLVKPFDPRELKARVDNLIASRKRLFERFEAAPRPLKVSAVEVTPADEAFLNRVQAMVEEHLADSDLSVEALARALRCDRSYLLRKLRTLTGEPPSALIRSLRLQRAEQLLRAGAGAVGEIAYSVGFKSVAHFSNAFQERYGERPSAFAARHRSG